METTNRKFVPLLLAFAIMGGVRAQSAPYERVQPTYIMQDNRVIGQLELDTLQRRQLEGVEQQYQKDLDALASNDTLSEAAATQRAQGLAARRQEQFQAILTPEQYQQWLQLLAAHKPD